MTSPETVWDAYWTFAHRRHEMWNNRITGGPAPWTDDPILIDHRFTNSYRVLDRVTQRLLSDVQYGHGRSQAVDEVFFRTILFKIFNRIETWELIERETGSVSWQSADRSVLRGVLDDAMSRGARLYSAAYIMPSAPFGHARKHANHVDMLFDMMERGMPGRIARADSLSEVYELILSVPSIGPFLAFQYTIDLNYSSMLEHEESSFVVAGPGALDGISKCLPDRTGEDPASVIMDAFNRQEDEFARLGLPFRGLFGRRLQPIDLQNCFCETSKYSRRSHPHVTGVADRSRIKQRYVPGDRPMDPLFLPPRWGIVPPASHTRPPAPSQPTLF